MATAHHSWKRLNTGPARTKEWQTRRKSLRESALAMSRSAPLLLWREIMTIFCLPRQSLPTRSMNLGDSLKRRKVSYLYFSGIFSAYTVTVRESPAPTPREHSTAFPPLANDQRTQGHCGLFWVQPYGRDEAR
jgi:hypothetical protein